MLNVFDARLLSTMYRSQIEIWTAGCLIFTVTDIDAIQVIIEVKEHLDLLFIYLKWVIYR